METKTNESKPTETEQNTLEALAPEQLDKVVGGAGAQQGAQQNHNQNVV